MDRTDRFPAGRTESADTWMVELNIAGCTIRRRAARRRHLLGIMQPSRAA